MTENDYFFKNIIKIGMKYKILIVDDHLVVRAGVTIILQSEIKKLDISYASNFPETIKVLNETVFDLIILDINIPGGKNTVMISDIRSILPDVKILMFSAHEEESYALRYLDAGANGYLNKLSGENKIVGAVKTIIETGKYISPEIANKLASNELNNCYLNPFDKLSKREIEIVKLLVKGNGNLEISNHLNIQMSTVSTYKNRVFEKLKLNNLVELIEKYNLHYS